MLVWKAVGVWVSGDLALILPWVPSTALNGSPQLRPLGPVFLAFPGRAEPAPSSHCPSLPPPVHLFLPFFLTIFSGSGD